MKIFLLLLDLIITAIAFLLVPTILSIARKQLTERQIKTIVIINGICVWLIFTIIKIEMGIKQTSFAVILWSGIAYWLMMKYCLKQEKAVNTKTNTNKVVRVAHKQNKKSRLDFKTLIIVILSLMLFVSIIFNISQFIKISRYKKTVISYNDITIEEHQGSGMTFAEWTEQYYK